MEDCLGSSNITVNGRPVQEFIGEQIGKEIRDVRTADQNVPVHRPAISKRNNSNLSHSRAGAGRSLIEMKGRATHVMMCGEMFDWLEKSIYGYTPSGHSIFGLLEICDETKELKCHHCGEWHRKLAEHITKKQDHPSVREYKLTHGLRLKTSPVHPEISAAASRRAKGRTDLRKFASGIKPTPPPRAEGLAKLRCQLAGKGQPAWGERANLMMGCQEQTLQKLVAYAAILGHTPITRELSAYVDENGAHSLHTTRLRNLFGVGLRATLVRAGLRPNKGQTFPCKSRKHSRIGPLLRDSQFFTNHAVQRGVQ